VTSVVGTAIRVMLPSRPDRTRTRNPPGPLVDPTLKNRPSGVATGSVVGKFGVAPEVPNPRRARTVPVELSSSP